jgi:outer membrane murein-binding lipoprotein Lpp
MNKKRPFILTAAIIISVFLTGCTGTPEEKIHEHLEKSVELEAQFKEQQALIVEAENKEQELYNEMVQLPLEEYDKIKELSEKALKHAEDRKQFITKEKEALNLAFEEFQNTLPFIEKINKEAVKKEADELEGNVQKRYDTYQQLNQEYETLITFDKELYKMLQSKELTAEEFDSQIEKINKQYEKVTEQYEAFNKYTDLYNNARQSFYKKADLNVVFEENKEK